MNKHEPLGGSAVYLSLGTNLGDRLQNLQGARSRIEELIGTVVQVSSVYSTEPWGVLEQPEFYNQALLVHTRLSAEDVLRLIQVIESAMGRQRILKWERRLIDIDILFFDLQIIQTESLIVPHPYLEKRNFVLAPMEELAPDFIHPVSGKTMRELYQTSTDTLKALRLNV